MVNVWMCVFAGLRVVEREREGAGRLAGRSGGRDALHVAGRLLLQRLRGRADRRLRHYGLAVDITHFTSPIRRSATPHPHQTHCALTDSYCVVFDHIFWVCGSVRSSELLGRNNWFENCDTRKQCSLRYSYNIVRDLWNQFRGCDGPSTTRLCDRCRHCNQIVTQQT